MPLAVELPFFTARPASRAVRVACFSCGLAYTAPSSEGATPAARCQHCSAVRVGSAN